jgi:hypothetical protein
VDFAAVGKDDGIVEHEQLVPGLIVFDLTRAFALGAEGRDKFPIFAEDIDAAVFPVSYIKGKTLAIGMEL